MTKRIFGECLHDLKALKRTCICFFQVYRCFLLNGFSILFNSIEKAFPSVLT